MDWQVILGAILGSSITTALLNAVFISHRDRKSASRSNEYWANILAAKLENYAVKAYEAMRASDHFFDHSGRKGNDVKIPEYQPLTLVKDHEFLAGKIRDTFMGFQDRVIIEKVGLDKFTQKLNDRYLVNEEVWLHVRTLGHEALIAAVQIRKIAGLAPRKIMVEEKYLIDILKPK